MDGGPSAFPVWPAAAHALYGSRKEEGGALASNLIPPRLLCRKEGQHLPSRQGGFSELSVWLCEASGFQILFGLEPFVQSMLPGSPTSARQPSEAHVGLLRRVQKPGICLFLRSWASGESPLVFVLPSVHYIRPLPRASDALHSRRILQFSFCDSKKPLL